MVCEMQDQLYQITVATATMIRVGNRLSNGSSFWVAVIYHRAAAAKMMTISLLFAGKAYKCCDKRPSGAEPFVYHVKKDTTEDKWVLEGSSTPALRVDDTRYNVLKCEDGANSNCRGSLALTINTRFLRGRPGNYNSDGDSGFDGVTSDTYYALALRPTAIYNEVDDGVVRPRYLPGIFARHIMEEVDLCTTPEDAIDILPDCSNNGVCERTKEWRVRPPGVRTLWRW